jgi:hypothetical protein
LPEIGEKRIPCAAAPFPVKGGCGIVLSVGVSANADVNCAGFFIASARRRCQANEKNFFHARAKSRNVAQNQSASGRDLKQSIESCGLSD